MYQISKSSSLSKNSQRAVERFVLEAPQIASILQVNNSVCSIFEIQKQSIILPTSSHVAHSTNRFRCNLLIESSRTNHLQIEIRYGARCHAVLRIEGRPDVFNDGFDENILSETGIQHRRFLSPKSHLSDVWKHNWRIDEWHQDTSLSSS